jgi:hypothetical protein
MREMHARTFASASAAAGICELKLAIRTDCSIRVEGDPRHDVGCHVTDRRVSSLRLF